MNECCPKEPSLEREIRPRYKLDPDTAFPLPPTSLTPLPSPHFMAPFLFLSFLPLSFFSGLVPSLSRDGTLAARWERRSPATPPGNPTQWLLYVSTWTLELEVRIDRSTNSRIPWLLEKPISHLGSWPRSSSTSLLELQKIGFGAEGRQFWKDEEHTSCSFPLFAECFRLPLLWCAVMSVLLFSPSTCDIANSTVSSVFQPSLLPLLPFVVTFPLQNSSFRLQSLLIQETILLLIILSWIFHLSQFCLPFPLPLIILTCSCYIPKMETSLSGCLFTIPGTARY